MNHDLRSKSAVRSVPSQDRRSARVIWIFSGKATLGGLAGVLLQPVGELHGQIDAFADLTRGLWAIGVRPPHLVEGVDQALEIFRQQLLAEGGVLARA